VQSLARSGKQMQREEPITARDMFTSLMVRRTLCSARLSNHHGVPAWHWHSRV